MNEPCWATRNLCGSEFSTPTGFEPRWDYQRKVPGQTTGSEAIGLLNRDSNAGYPENIPSQVVRAMSSERHYA
jgi:hypothetical protein